MMNNMTLVQLEVQSRKAIKDWCIDPYAQLECCRKGSDRWQLRGSSWINTDIYYYRIANKPIKFYRVALMMNGSDCYTKTVDNEIDENDMKDRAGFIEWLSERVYYNETNTTFREKVISTRIRNKVKEIIEEDKL